MATDLNKLLRAQAQRQKQQVKKILAEDKGAKSKRRPYAQTLIGLKNIQGEEEEVRAFFRSVNDENIVQELQRFMNSKPIWKGRKSFFQKFMGLVPEDQYVHFKEHYLNQDLDFKKYFDTVYKPKFIDTDIFNTGKYDEILRDLFNRYLTMPKTQYEIYENDLINGIQMNPNNKVTERFIDILNIFKNDIDDKNKFASLFLENNLSFEDFYLKYMGGDFDIPEREGGKVEEKPKIRRKPLMIDEQGNIVEIPTHNLYKFEGPRNRLPIVSREQFRKAIEEEGHGIPTQVIELAKIELKTNLNLSNNVIDEIIDGLTEKYHKVNKFILKLGEIILYYVNNFVIKNQGNRIASLYRDRIENNLINFRNLAYAKKSDFLPELFQFKNAEEVSVNMVGNFISRQLEIFLNNFKNKLYVYITNVSAKAKNIHISINNVVIVSNAEQTDYFIFGYTNEKGENLYFDIRNKPANLPKKLARRLSKVYSIRVVSSVDREEDKKEVEQDEVINIEEIYDLFIESLNEMDVEMSDRDSSSEQESESSQQGSEIESESESESNFEEEEESESEESSSSEENKSNKSEMKNDIRLSLRKRMADIIKNKLTAKNELGKPIIDKIIVNNNANIEKSITDMIEEYEDNNELNILLKPELKDKHILKYLKANIPDIFKDSDESKEEEESKAEAKAEAKAKGKAKAKPKNILDSDSEGSDSPVRSCKCIKCGEETSQNLKTKIKDGNEFKTVCFCSFKCFEKYKN